MNRTARAAALGLFTVLALSGCLRYNIDATFDSDNTASGSVVTAVQEGIGEQMGVDSDQAALDELFADSPFAADAEQFSVEDYAQDDYIGKRYTFNDLDLDQFNAVFGEQFTVTRVGDEFVLASETAPANADELDQIPTEIESMLSITFPGEVTDTNGTVEGNTVTWDLFSQTEPLAATANATGGSSFPVTLLLIGVGVLVVLIAVALGLVWLVRNQRSAAPSDMPPPPPPPPPAPSTEHGATAPLAPPTPTAPLAPPTPTVPPAPPAPPAPPVPPAPPEEPPAPEEEKKK